MKMLNILKVALVISSIFVSNLMATPYSCSNNISCDTKLKRDENRRVVSSALTCSIPSMPKLSVTAKNVFDSNGTTLKIYWEAQNTVCDVMEWIDIAASKRSVIQGMNISLSTPETIVLKISQQSDNRAHVASYKKYQLALDRDSNNNMNHTYLDEDPDGFVTSDGNVFSTIMNDLVAHEFFHYLQEKVDPALAKNFVTEGTARFFEDEVYDSLSAYSLSNSSGVRLFNPMYGHPYISDILTDGIANSEVYKTFVFWKLMQSKASSSFDVPDLINRKEAGLIDSAKGFSENIIVGDPLGSMFVYYNWAMIWKNGDITEIDGNEPATTIFKDHDSLVEFQTFSSNINILDLSSPVSSIPAYGAKSFTIKQDVLNTCGELELDLQSNVNTALVAIRVDQNGNSNPSNSFSLRSGSTYILSDVDKQGDLFVTLVNSGAAPALVSKLSLSRDKNVSACQPTTCSGGITTTSGVVEATLTWDGNGSMDLSVGLPGSYDSNGCNFKHFFVESEYSIYPGKYSVNVSGSGDVNGTLIIKVPGQVETFSLDGSGSLGHVADIVITQNQGEFNFVPQPVNNPSIGITHRQSVRTGGSGGGSYGGSGGGGYTPLSLQPSICSGNFSCGCIPCEYSIVRYLKQALKGPIGGAKVSLHTASSFGRSEPIYTDVTSGGGSLYTTGLIDMSEAFESSLDDNELYVFTVSKGLDVDTNDDLVIDSYYTVNQGSLHTLLTGKAIKEIGFKVNMLTEIAYQNVKHMLAGEASNTEIITKLDEISKRLLVNKVYADDPTELSHVDLALWIPATDKYLMFSDYDTYVQPIVDQLFVDADIYQASYDLVYKFGNASPQLSSSSVYVTEDVTAGTDIGSITITEEGFSAITDIRLEGEGSENFNIDPSGRLSLLTSLDFETKNYYKLSMVATNNHGESKPVALYVVVQDVVDVPFFSEYIPQTIFDNAQGGTLFGQTVFDQGKEVITHMQLSGEDAAYFDIDAEGNIRVVDLTPLRNSATGNMIRIDMSIIASNGLGNSRPVKLSIDIPHAGDLPTLATVNFHLDEDALEGTLVGQLHFAEGSSPVESFNLSGAGSEEFIVDTQGNVYVSEYAQLDFERENTYLLRAVAKNSLGEGSQADVIISLNDKDDVPIIKDNVHLKVKEDVSTSTLIGNILQAEGTAAVEAISINGTGHEKFRVDIDGNIFATTTLDYEQQSFYYLDLVATNAEGSSVQKIIKIEVQNVMDVPELKSVSTQLYDKTPVDGFVARVLVNEGSSAITSMILSGAGSEDFQINSQGLITVAMGLDYHRQSYYTLHLKAYNGAGVSFTHTVTIVLYQGENVPLLGSLNLDVNENISDVVLAQLSIDDKNSTLSSLVLSGTGSENFTIALDGTFSLSPTAKIDYETQKQYNLEVVGTNANGSSRSYITVKVLDSIDIPVILGFEMSVDENVSIGTILGKINVITEGLSSIDSFELVGQDAQSFTLAPSLEITNNTQFDYDRGIQNYTFKVTAKNSYGSSVPAIVTIHVNNVADIPEIHGIANNHNSTVYIDENSVPNTVIAQLNLIQGQDPIRSILLSGSGNEHFTADSNGTIRVSATATIDYDYGYTYYRLKAIASTQTETSLAQDIYIYVNDLNDIPSIENKKEIYVDENTAPFTQIGDINVSSGASPINSISLIGVGSENFTIDAEGKIYISQNGSIDYESMRDEAFYRFQVLASNAYGNARLAYVYIYVNDVDDAPKIKDFGISIDENTSNGSLIGTLEIIQGADPIEAITLSLEGNENFFVNIAGEVYLQPDANIDYENIQSYQLKVQAMTATINSNLANVNILINNVIDIPVLKDLNVSVNENGTLGSLVGEIDTLKFGDAPISEYVLSGAGSEEFSLGVNGSLALQSTLSFDYERSQEYNLSVYAITGIGNSEPASIHIAVKNLLDAPTYLNLNTNVREDVSLNTIIGRLESLEIKDTEATSMQLTGEGNEKFSISSNGDVALLEQLDYEQKADYNLKAIASSIYGDSNEVDVYIAVDDVDERARAGVGLWAHANVNIYKLEDNGTTTLLFSETTSSGGSYEDMGLFDSHRLELDKDKFYLYEVNGGEELDADRDGVLDVTPTVNTGTLRAITKGEWVRKLDLPMSINMMTDVFYHYVEDYWNTNNVTSLESSLLTLSNPISTIGGKGSLTHNSVLQKDQWKYYVFSYANLDYMASLLYSSDEKYKLFVKNSFLNSTYYSWNKAKNTFSLDTRHLYTIDYSYGLKVFQMDILTEGAQSIFGISYAIMDKSSDSSFLAIKKSEGEASDAIVLIDVIDPLTPKVISSTSLSTYFSQMKLTHRADKIFVTSGGYGDTGLGFIDISNKSTPVEVSSDFNTHGTIVDFIFSSDDMWMYIADERGGLQIVDISGSDMSIVGNYMVYGLIEQVKLSSDETKLMISINQGSKSFIHLIDISDKTNPINIASFETEDEVSAMTLSQNEQYYFILNSSSKKVLIYEKIFANDGNIVLLSELSGTWSGRNATDIYLYDNELKMLVVTDYDIFVYDISDKSNPILLESVIK